MQWEQISHCFENYFYLILSKKKERNAKDFIEIGELSLDENMGEKKEVLILF